MKVSGVDAQARLNFAANNMAKNKKVEDSQSPKPVSIEPSSTPIAGTTPINFTSIHRTKAKMITFGSSDKIKGQTLFVGAELPPYCKVGGVATVMQDYGKIFKGPMVIPYYNGNLVYDKKGEPTGEVGVLMKDGKAIYTNQDLTKVSVENLKPGQFFELEEISKKTMQWTENKADNITLYKVKDTNHFMVYTDATAKMSKPYENAGGGFAYGSDGKVLNSPQGDSYAKFNKALVEMLPDMEKHGVNPEHILLSDSQSANVFEYIQDKALKGDKYFQDCKASYIMHNIGGGYQGETSAENMFHNFATKEQAELVKQDPHYIKAKLEGTTEKYFKQFIQSGIDEKNCANVSMIPIQYAKLGITNLDAVSETYAESAAKNPLVAKGLTGHLEEGAKDKWFGGILNGFDDNSFNPEKEIGMTFYKAEFKDEKTGITHKPFELFKKDAPINEIITKKQLNAKNMFQRLYKDANPDFAMGLPGKGKLIGHIDQKWSQQIDKFIAGDKNAKVNVFSSWGRGDFQKGLDIVLDAFIAHTKTDEGKNSVLIFGGELPKNTEGENLRAKLDKAFANGMEGRVVYMDGFAPNKPLAAASDSCVFASRFEPCGLTDFEAMLHGGASPIVVGTQGLAQKNFNPSDADKTTGYKTAHEFYMSQEDLSKISKTYKEEYDKMIKEELDFLNLKKITAPIEIKNEETGAVLEKYTTLEELAAKKVQATPEFENLHRKWSDEILSQEISEAMTLKSKQFKENPALMEKQIRNSLNVKSGWNENNALHPSGKSSVEMYNERHFNGGKKFGETKGRIFDFSKEKMEEIKGRIKNTDSGIVEIATSKEFWKQHGGKIGVAVGAVAIIGGIAALFSKSKKPATNADGDTFKRTSPSKNKNVQNKPISAANKRNQAQRHQQNLQSA